MSNFSMRGQHQHQPQDAGRRHGSLRELYRAGGQPADQLCPRGLPKGNATISIEGSNMHISQIVSYCWY